MASGFLGLYGEGGVLSMAAGRVVLPKGFWAVVAAHVYYNIPLSMMLVYGSLAGIPREELEALRIYGGGGTVFYRALLRVIAPYLYPALATAASLTFIYCFTSFTIPLVLGGGYGYYTLEVFIYVYYKTLFKPRLAEAVAFLQLLVLSALTALYVYVSRKTPLPRPGHRTRLGLGRRARVLGALYLAGVSAYLYLPLLVVPYNALRDPETGSWSLRGFSIVLSSRYNPYLMIEPVKALYNSLYFALAATLLSLTAALLVASSRRLVLEIVAAAPLAISPLTLALGLVRTYWGLLADWHLIIISHGVAALPLASRSIALGFSRIRGVFSETAYVHGVRGLDYVFLVALPAIAPALTAAVSFSMAASLGEFGATLFIHEPSSATLSILVYKLRLYAYRAAGTAGYLQASYAAATLLMLASSILLYAAARRSERWL